MTRRLAAILFVCLAAACAWQARIDVHDGFEGARLDKVWATDRFQAGSVTMQSDVVRAGKGAARIVLHRGEVFEAGRNGNKDSERAELAEAERFYSREDRTYEFSFSQYLPADFPVVPVRLVLAQWKQDCKGHAPCDDASPVVAVRYTGGVMQITLQTAEHRRPLYETREELRGRWLDYRFRIRFTPRADGLLQAWLGEKQVVDYHGATAYPESPATGYDSPSQFYFKMGLYRDTMEQPMTLYIDEYRKREVE